jgi:hypothetical protein
MQEYTQDQLIAREEIITFEADQFVFKGVLDDILLARNFYLKQLADKFKSLHPIEKSLSDENVLDLGNLSTYNKDILSETTFDSIHLVNYGGAFKIKEALEQLGLTSSIHWINENILSTDWAFESDLIIDRPSGSFINPPRPNNFKLIFDHESNYRFPEEVNRLEIEGKSLKNLAKNMRKAIKD